MGEVGGGMRMLLRKILHAFPSWIRGAAKRNAFTRPGTLFPFSLMDAGKGKKNKKLSGHVPSLSAGRPRGRARRKRETRLRFPAPKPSMLANEKRHCPIRFVVRHQGYPDSGTGCDRRCSESTKTTSFLTFVRIRLNLINILRWGGPIYRELPIWWHNFPPGFISTLTMNARWIFPLNLEVIRQFLLLKDKTWWWETNDKGWHIPEKQAITLLWEIAHNNPALVKKCWLKQILIK